MEERLKVEINDWNQSIKGALHARDHKQTDEQDQAIKRSAQQTKKRSDKR